MARIKTTRDIECFRAAGKRLAEVFLSVKREVAPGVTTQALNDHAERLIRAGGDRPAFLRYMPDGARYPFPATLCVSVNDEVVHGIPGERILRSGDIAGLDLGLVHDGFYVDMAETVPVGAIDPAAERLIAATRGALAKGVSAIIPGARTGDVGHAIETHIREEGFAIVKELGGHGVGRMLHEEPYIPNFGKRRSGTPLVPGMTIAIEPIVNEGKRHVVLGEDGYTYRTRDGKRSAHFEHTVLVTDTGAEVLTII